MSDLKDGSVAEQAHFLGGHLNCQWSKLLARIEWSNDLIKMHARLDLLYAELDRDRVENFTTQVQISVLIQTRNNETCKYQ